MSSDEVEVEEAGGGTAMALIRYVRLNPDGFYADLVCHSRKLHSMILFYSLLCKLL